MLTHREKSLVENFIELLTPNKVIHNIEDMVEKDNKDFKLNSLNTMIVSLRTPLTEFSILMNTKTRTTCHTPPGFHDYKTTNLKLKKTITTVKVTPALISQTLMTRILETIWRVTYKLMVTTTLANMQHKTADGEMITKPQTKKNDCYNQWLLPYQEWEPQKW